MQKRIFEENQTDKRWELIALIGLLSVGLTYRFVEQNFITPVDHALSLSAFLMMIAALLVALTYVTSRRLSVKVTEEFISFRYHPFQEKRHKILWSEVASCEIVKMSETAQWNGWNVSFSREKMFSVSGRNGMSIKTKSGEKYFIGSKNIEGLREAVNKVYP